MKRLKTIEYCGIEILPSPWHLGRTEEEGVQASVGQVVVDKQPLLSLQTNSKKLCEVVVPELGYQEQLVPQFLQALP